LLTRFLPYLWTDLRVQFRSGFFLVYGVVSLIYGLVVSAFPQEFRPVTLVVLIFTDPATLGFFFVGAQVLKERQEGSWSALTVSQTFGWPYLLAKALSYFLLGLWGTAVVLLVAGHVPVNPLHLILALFLASGIYTLLGVALVCRVKSVNEYFYKSVITFLPFFFPVLGLIPGLDWSFWNAWPLFPDLRILAEGLLGSGPFLFPGFSSPGSLNHFFDYGVLLCWLLLVGGVAFTQIKKSQEEIL
jgi:fluoroquinolone transport system permease protein